MERRPTRQERRRLARQGHYVAPPIAANPILQIHATGPDEGTRHIQDPRQPARRRSIVPLALAIALGSTVRR